MTWLLLIMAIMCEVTATLSLKVAATGHRRWFAVVVAGYVAAFVLISLALGQGLPLGVAYGIWAAAGVALTAVLSKPLLKEPLTPVMLAGIALIMLGVVLIELGAAR